MRELERPGHVFRDLGPNWFASVMGTGIVANAAAALPFRVAGLHVFALVVWVLAAGWLVALSAGWAVHWARHADRARGHAANPVMAQFWGAPAMALMTVGTGALLLGRDWIGLGAAVDADWVLWGLGTALGLVTTCWIPYLMMTRHEIKPDGAFGGWLMPVVPPMVSAASGALLVPYAAAGQARLTLLLGCYAMFGISLFASVIIITLVWGRLVTYKTLPAVMVPTCWIVLGPLGQSITAAGNLAKVAGLAMHGPYVAGAAVFAVLYGVPTWGFAMAWLAIAAAVTLRTARKGLPFGLTWWSFTFPVGTCVTGTIVLAARTHADVLRYGAAGLFLLLLAAWLIVAAQTARGGASGRLFLAPLRAPAPVRSGGQKQRSEVEGLAEDVDAKEHHGHREDPVTVIIDDLGDPRVAGDAAADQAPDRDQHREGRDADQDLARVDRGVERRVRGEVIAAVDDRDRRDAVHAGGRGGSLRLLATAPRADHAHEAEGADPEREEGEHPQEPLRRQRQAPAQRQRHADEDTEAHVLPGPYLPVPGRPTRPCGRTQQRDDDHVIDVGAREQGHYGSDLDEQAHGATLDNPVQELRAVFNLVRLRRVAQRGCVVTVRAGVRVHGNATPVSHKGHSHSETHITNRCSSLGFR